MIPLRSLFAGLLATLILLPAAAQETAPVALSVETVAELATAASPTLARRRRAVDEAADALGLGAYADALTLTLSGGIGGSTATDFASDGSATLALDLDLLPQLTLSGSLVARVDGPEGPDAPPPTGPEPEPLAASANLAFTPLADAGGRARDELALARARSALESDAREVAYGAISLLVEAATLQSQTPLAERRVELAEERLTSVLALAERGRATDDEVQSARNALRSARQSLARHEISVQRSIARLSRATGIPDAAIVLPSLEELAPSSATEAIADSLDSFDSDAAVSAAPTIVAAGHDLEAARIDEATTRRFSPVITATAGVDAPELEWSLGVSVRVSPEDWDGEAAREAEEERRFAEEALAAERAAVTLNLELAILDVRIAMEELEAASEEVTLAERDVAEALFRFDRGDITRVALEEARLARDETQLDLRETRTTLLLRWYRVDLVQF